MKHSKSGVTLQGWLKPTMEPVPARGRGADGLIVTQGDTSVAGRGKPGFVGRKPWRAWQQRRSRPDGNDPV